MNHISQSGIFSPGPSCSKPNQLSLPWVNVNVESRLFTNPKGLVKKIFVPYYCPRPLALNDTSTSSLMSEMKMLVNY